MQHVEISSDADSDKRISYVVASDEASVVWLANLACIELHQVHSRQPRLESPDYMVFDLDPVYRKHNRNMELVSELAGIFLTDTPRGLREIAAAVERQDLAQAERIAKGLKRACANLGVSALAGLFAEIETHSREGRPEEVLEAHGRAGRLYASVEAALEKV